MTTMYKYCECDRCHNAVETLSITRRGYERLCKSCHNAVLTEVPIQIEAIKSILVEVRDTLWSVSKNASADCVKEDFEKAEEALDSMMAMYKGVHIELVEATALAALISAEEGK